MKSIVFVIESFQLGGSEKSLVTLLQHLDYSKYKVDVIAFHKGGIFEELIPPKVTIHFQDFPLLNLWERSRYKIQRLLNKNKAHTQQLLFPIIKNKLSNFPLRYDVAIAFSQGFSTYFTSTRITAAVKYSWLNVDYQAAKYQLELDLPYYYKFNAIAAVSDSVLKGLQQEAARLSVTLPICTIPDIIDTEMIIKQSAALVDYPTSSAAYQILTVGRLMNEKGLLLAVEACSILVKKGYDIVWSVVGEGSQRPILEQKIAEFSLTNRFMLLGMSSNPYPYMSACDIYVQTSLYEGLGLTLIEAIALSKPIVTTDFPTAFDVICNGENGLIVEKTASAIAEGIEKYIKDELFKCRMVEGIQIEKINSKDATLQLFYALLDAKL
jgi:glycosyltransferase involved in cell wall biosynthesis